LFGSAGSDAKAPDAAGMGNTCPNDRPSSLSRARKTARYSVFKDRAKPAGTCRGFRWVGSSGATIGRPWKPGEGKYETVMRGSSPGVCRLAGATCRSGRRTPVPPGVASPGGSFQLTWTRMKRRLPTLIR
jgi:hypothetical protein